MAACPVCHGTDLQEIAPGYYECHSYNDARDGTCRERFQVSGMPHQPAIYCGCGTFAIGRCVECKRPICGDHSQLTDSGRLCGDHYATLIKQQNAPRGDDAVAVAGRLIDTFLEVMRAAGNPGAEVEMQSGGHSATLFGGRRRATRRFPEPTWRMGVYRWLSVSGAMVERREWEGTGDLTPPPPDFFYPPYREPMAFARGNIQYAIDSLCDSIERHLLEHRLVWPSEGGKPERLEVATLSLPTPDEAELDAAITSFYHAISAANYAGATHVHWYQDRGGKPGYLIGEARSTGMSGGHQTPLIITTEGSLLARLPHSSTGQLEEFSGPYIRQAIFRILEQWKVAEDLRVGMLRVLARHQIEPPTDAWRLSPYLR